MQVKRHVFSSCYVMFFAVFLFSCEEGNSSSQPDPQDSDTGTDTDTSTNLDCQEQGGETGDECTENELCNCDNICGDTLFGLDSQSENVITTYCFRKCVVGEKTCQAQTEMCAPTPVEDVGVCVPIGVFASSNFEMPIYSASAIVKPADWSTTNKVTAQMGTTTLPKANAAAGALLKNQTKYQLSFLLGTSLEELWSLIIDVPADKWKPGTLKIGGFQAALFHSQGTEENLRLWYEAGAATGTLELTETPTPCEDPATNCAMAKGTIQIGLVGFRNEIAAE